MANQKVKNKNKEIKKTGYNVKYIYFFFGKKTFNEKSFL